MFSTLSAIMLAPGVRITNPPRIFENSAESLILGVQGRACAAFQAALSMLAPE
jgi:hypothetical protein